MKTFSLTNRGTFFLLLILAFTLSACHDDTEPVYEGYGLVNKTEHNDFSITLDNGTRIYPRESILHPDEVKDSTRICLRYHILEEQDTCAFIRLLYADTILTQKIISYDESLLDSIGDDPIKITSAWFAHGFLNFEFVFAGRAYPYNTLKHMVNLVQLPSSTNKLAFEFRHNDFNDPREQIYIGAVSFPIGYILENLPGPIKMEIKFHDSYHTSRSIELIYEK